MSIPLPTKIEYVSGAKPTETIVTIEPLYPGYGHTIGVALRRALLSSLEGGAIIAVKIKGVQHEFSTLPYVKEDVVDIILNLKKLRFNVFSSEPVKLFLQVRGEQDVRASTIESTSDAEVANPDAFICTLTNKNAHLEMELIVKKGRGYYPTEAREKEKLEIGTIAIDALFTPIRNVGLHVEDVRVGQMTNYNKIVMSIETDGNVNVAHALAESARVLVEQYATIGTLAVQAAHPQEASGEGAGEEWQETGASGPTSEEQTGEQEVPKKRGRPKKT